jgi:hypothetical protein
MSEGFAPDYVDVAERVRDFRKRFPTGSLRPLNAERPFEVVELGTERFVVYVAACYRSPDDRLPGVGSAWEPVPGRTPFTRGSELMNAETSAWGRAIVAALVADAKRIASADEVANRRDEPGAPGTVAQRAVRLTEWAKRLQVDGLDIGAARAEAGLPTIKRATRAQLDAWEALLADLERGTDAEPLDESDEGAAQPARGIADSRPAPSAAPSSADDGGIAWEPSGPDFSEGSLL